jgi:hypothetical protein
MQIDVDNQKMNSFKIKNDVESEGNYTRKITCADVDAQLEPSNREAIEKLNREIIWKRKTKYRSINS